MPGKRNRKKKAATKACPVSPEAPAVTSGETQCVNLALPASVILWVFAMIVIHYAVPTGDRGNFAFRLIALFGPMFVFAFVPKNVTHTKTIGPTTPSVVLRDVTEELVRGESRMCDAAYRFPLLKVIADDDAYTGTRLVELTVEANKHEIECIASLLHETYSDAKIFRISRVMNRTHHESFLRVRHTLLVGRTHWETFAWHGTRRVPPVSIINSDVGFDPACAFSGVATTWFAERAAYSRGFEHHMNYVTGTNGYDGSVIVTPMKQLFLARLLVSKKDEHRPLPNRIWTLANAAARSMPAYLVTYQ